MSDVLLVYKISAPNDLIFRMANLEINKNKTVLK